MPSESYTPGHSQNAVDFMAERTLESHGSFFTPYLETGVSVLDCGCGPGSITLGIAGRTVPGEVVGVDFEQSQVDRATAEAKRRGVDNVRFESLDFIGEYLALQLECDGDEQSATVFREWSRQSDGMFAQAWVSAVAVKPAI